MERICVYPGSFDPLTVGHLDIIRRAAGMFDRVIVAVLFNPAKTGCFTVAQRLEMIRLACADIPQAEADSFDGLLVDYLRLKGARHVIRGLRTSADFESEKTMAYINAALLPGMETVFLPARPEHMHISSSAVRELAGFGGDFTGFVPLAGVDMIKARFNKK